jgi:hypothetical protein
MLKRSHIQIMTIRVYNISTKYRGSVLFLPVSVLSSKSRQFACSGSRDFIGRLSELHIGSIP